MHFRVWLSRTVFESMLIVLSILLALGVREWQMGRDAERLIQRSLLSFERELEQNRNLINDLYPFHLGLRSLLGELDAETHPDLAGELRNILDSFQPAALLTTAWDTALATGALSEMDYELAFALSLTYSIQERFQNSANTGLVELVSASRATDDVTALEDAALRYVNEISAAEGELLAVYQQAIELLSQDPLLQNREPTDRPGAEPQGESR